ncbi:MAG: TfoX/Sxy family DNA transformation protein [Proteobacteria bacterium]|nr:TfoX/Sxy family DNA transformation protein [Pseudomonadota bacterium]
MSRLKDLKNIGPTLANRLEEIGVLSRSDLQAMGAARAYRRIQARYPDAHLPLCYYLYSLEGALHDKDWRSFTAKQKLDMQKKIKV